MTHDEVSELLGAFALDAVDGEEYEQIEAHLSECPRCRAEVDAHREVAAALGNRLSHFRMACGTTLPGDCLHDKTKKRHRCRCSCGTLPASRGMANASRTFHTPPTRSGFRSPVPLDAEPIGRRGHHCRGSRGCGHCAGRESRPCEQSNLTAPTGGRPEHTHGRRCRTWNTWAQGRERRDSGS